MSVDKVQFDAQFQAWKESPEGQKFKGLSEAAQISAFVAEKALKAQKNAGVPARPNKPGEEKKLDELVKKINSNPNVKAQLELAVKQFPDDPNVQLFKEALYKAQLEDVYKNYQDLCEQNHKRKDFFEKHTTYVDKEAYNKAMKEFVEKGGSKKEFKKDNTLITNKKVLKAIKEAKDLNGNDMFFDADGKFLSDAYKKHMQKYAGGNYYYELGIHPDNMGGQHQDELREVGRNLDGKPLTVNQSRKAAIAAGLGAEKPTTGLGAAMAKSAGIGAALGAPLGAGLGLGLGLALKGIGVNLSVDAKAAAINAVTGEILANDGAFKTVSKTLLQLIGTSVGATTGIGAAVGAVIGGLAAAATTAINYKYNGRHNLLNGNQDGIRGIIEDPMKMVNFNREVSDADYYPVLMMELVKEAGYSTDEIEAAIKGAIGEDNGHLPIDEFAAAMEALVKNPPKGDKKSEEKPIEAVESKPIEGKVDGPTSGIVGPNAGKPVVNKPVDDKPSTDEDSPVKDKLPVDSKELIVGIGMSWGRIAKRLGIKDVKALIEANKGRNVVSGHENCEQTAKTYLKMNAKIVLPDDVEIDPELLAKYEEEFTVEKNNEKYLAHVTSEKFYRTNRDCYKNILAAGPVAEKAAIGRLIEEAKGVGLNPEYTPDEFMKEKKENRMDTYNKLLNAVNEALFAEQERQIKAAEAARRAKAGQPEYLVPPEGEPTAKSFAPGHAGETPERHVTINLMPGPGNPPDKTRIQNALNSRGVHPTEQQMAAIMKEKTLDAKAAKIKQMFGFDVQFAV